jgi:hypothetical protein
MTVLMEARHSLAVRDGGPQLSGNDRPAAMEAGGRRPVDQLVRDSLESRFFDADAIAGAFGAVAGPTPPLADRDPDPVVSRAPAFGSRAFA